MPRSSGSSTDGFSLEKLSPEGRRASTALVLSIVLTIAAHVVPYGDYVLYPLMLLSTFAHEMGHGMAAIVMGGSFVEFRMWSDGSGVASMLLPQTRFAAAFSSMGGLVGPALMAALLFILGARPRFVKPLLYVMCGAMVLCTLLVVRGAFGIGFSLTYAAAFGVLAHYAPPGVQQFSVVFVATQLGLTVFSRGDYLFTPYAETSAGRMPSDVMQIANAWVLPYWFWGALIGLFSVGVLYVGVRAYLDALWLESTGKPRSQRRLPR